MKNPYQYQEKGFYTAHVITMKVALSVSPNNQFKLTISSLEARQKRKSDSLAAVRSSRMAVHHGNALMEIVQGRSGGIAINAPGESKYSVLSNRGLAIAKEVQTRSLDIIREFQRAYLASKKKNQNDSCRLRAGWGFSGRRSQFTRLARHRILCGGAVLARESDTPASSTFCTFTLPGNTTDAINNLSRWASYVCNRLLQYIRREDRRHSEPFKWFYSWEHQKRGALHLHLCLYHPKAGTSYAMGLRLKEAWFSILMDIDKITGVCSFTRRGGKECVLPGFWRVDIQPVRKSIAAYVSKYVSKGAATSPSGQLRFTPPPRWWGMARGLLRQVKAQCSTVTFDALTEDEASALYVDFGRLIELHKVVQTYQYSFDISHGDYHVGSGIVSNYYLSEDDFLSLSALLHKYISALPSVSLGCVVGGSGYLYKQFSEAA